MNIGSKDLQVSKKNQVLLIVLLMVLALGLRIPTLNMGLWLDECITVFVITQPTIAEMISNLIVQDFNPPLSHLITRGFVSVFGLNETTVRVPSLIYGVLLVPAMYWLGRISGSSRVGLWCALFVALSPIANYFACQARPYSLGLLSGALATAFFCLLVTSEKRRWINISGYVISASVFCYATTLGVVLPGAIFLAGLFIKYLDSARSVSGQSQLPREKSPLKLYEVFLTVTVPYLLMLPWVPNVLMQAKQPLPIPPGGLLNAPFIFAYNLVMMIPLPIWMGLLIVISVACYLAYWLVKMAIKKAKGEKLSPSFELFRTMPSHLIVLLFAVVIPSCFVGVFTPFSFGYFRYVVPFSPAGWVLAAILLERFVFSDYGSKIMSAKALTLLLAGFIFVSDIWYVVLFDQRHQSGMRGMARAVKAGSYDNSLIVVGPDLPSATLAFYLPVEARKKHNVSMQGFVRWDAETPVPVPDIPELWNNKNVTSQTLERIGALRNQGFKKLVLVVDKHYMKPFKGWPLKIRMEEFQKELELQYGKPIDKALYKGLVENVDVYVYRFDQKDENNEGE